MKSVCVFAGSNPGAREEYAEAARDLARTLVRRGCRVVYGGGNVGLMGELADAALADGGEVIGVIPAALVAREVAHRGLTELRIVSSMHERKAAMADLSDGFIALPGGWGTLEELFEVLTWGQLGLHPKPCGVLNVCGYFDGLLSFLEHSMHERFVPRQYASMLQVGTSADEMVDAFTRYAPPVVEKWIDRGNR